MCRWGVAGAHQLLLYCLSVKQLCGGASKGEQLHADGRRSDLRGIDSPHNPPSIVTRLNRSRHRTQQVKLKMWDVEFMQCQHDKRLTSNICSLISKGLSTACLYRLQVIQINSLAAC